MTLIQAFILGIVQGLTEFLPISSSGHLALLKNLLGVKIQNPLGFDIALHTGTALSVIIFMRSEIAHAFRSREKSLGIFIAFIFTVPVALFLKKFSELAEGDLLLLSLFFFVGGAIIVFLPMMKLIFPVKFRYPIIGVFQGISALPGVSRSGTTISACLMLGMSKDEAFNFSFLLSIPTILSAIAYELFDVLRGEGTFGDVGVLNLLVGIITSFFVGILALSLMRKIVIHGKLWFFGIYMFLVSFFAFMVEIYR